IYRSCSSKRNRQVGSCISTLVSSTNSLVAEGERATLEAALRWIIDFLQQVNRTYFINPRVCDGGDAGCSFRSKAAAIPRVLQGFATTKCARSAPSLRVAARTGAC